MLTLDDPFVQGIIEDAQTQQFFNKKWQNGINTNKRPVTDILKNDSWKGRRCFVLAGGPSLTNFDFSLLENELTIGINRIYESLDCTILFAMDGRFYNWILEGKYGKIAKTKFVNFNGMKIWLDLSNLPINNVFYIRSSGRKGLSWNLANGLCHGNNSGYGALNLALVLGANPIYLLGYDMKFKNGKGHYHDGHPIPFVESMMNSFRNSFNQKIVHEELALNKRKVINLNRDSNLKCFEFGDLPIDLHEKNKHRVPIFCSYYTMKYKNEVVKLRDDIWRHSLKNNIEAMKDFGSWMINCHQKPFFLKRMLEKYPRNPIVWLDADARIRQFPKLFYNLKCDVGIHIRKKRKGGVYGEEVLSGTIFLKNNKKVIELLNLWINEKKKIQENGIKEI